MSLKQGLATIQNKKLRYISCGEASILYNILIIMVAKGRFDGKIDGI
jgi:hypothetical protein